MSFVWMSCLPSTRTTEPLEITDDKPVARLEDARQLVEPPEPPALLRGLSGGGRLDEVVYAEVVRTRVLENGQSLGCAGCSTASTKSSHHCM